MLLGISWVDPRASVKRLAAVWVFWIIGVLLLVPGLSIIILLMSYLTQPWGKGFCSDFVGTNHTHTRESELDEDMKVRSRTSWRGGIPVERFGKFNGHWAERGERLNQNHCTIRAIRENQKVGHLQHKIQTELGRVTGRTLLCSNDRTGSRFGVRGYKPSCADQMIKRNCWVKKANIVEKISIQRSKGWWGRLKLIRGRSSSGVKEARLTLLL
ncbi:hypothetical protein F5877DRAFT_69885 [Lentinula edodes]|nr:hypothetical protein F5877DRAFT_69885 [Lentinula edodes]